MINISLLSAWSIFVALFGVTLNAFVTTPYTKVAYLVNETKMKRHKIKETIGRIANFLIIIGTVGQLVSNLISS